jgi:probable rRNA maturation factor
LKINIYYDGINYRIKESKKVKYLIEKVIRYENKVPGDLHFIITNDRTIKQINIEFLNCNYFTDVITFNYNENETINGEIYISIDTVKKNANNYKVSLYDEILRVIIHGVLHLCGYNDKKGKDIENMRKIEDKWIKEMIKN